MTFFGSENVKEVAQIACRGEGGIKGKKAGTDCKCFRDPENLCNFANKEIECFTDGP